MMTRRPLYLALLIALLGLIGFLLRQPFAGALGIAGAAVPLVLGWRAVRSELSRRLAEETRHAWLAGAEAPPERVSQLEGEWSGLGYEPLGILQSDRAGAVVRRSVFRHPELPIWAWVEQAPGSEAVACAVTFFEGGGRVLTTSLPLLDAGALASLGNGTAPRLVQLRPQGRPLALDGQHAGTVRAWTAGKRRALPASQESLVPLLQEERGELRRHLEAGRGLTFLDYLRLLVGLPRGVLTF